MSRELWRLSASELAGGIARGEFSSSDAVEAHIARIEEVNPAINAVTQLLGDSAIEAAVKADQKQARGDELGPFHGVPYSIKENIDLLGSPTTQGVEIFANAMPTQNSPSVERMANAGAIALSRTNLPDLGLRVTTESQLYGATHNPWRHGLTAGGSSGGEAAALASGMTPIGLGNDIGGSLRNPAFCCGVVALKGTFGRVPRALSIQPSSPSLAGQLMSVDGPMARRVSDLRVAFSVLAGVHERDPWSVPAPIEGPKLPMPIRVAVVENPPGGETHHSAIDGVRKAADALSDAGYELVSVNPPDLELGKQLWASWLQTELAASREALTLVMGPEGLSVIEQFEVDYPTLDSAALVALQITRHGLAREWSLFQAEHPLILGPVWTDVQFAHGYDVSDLDAGRKVLDRIRFTVVMNLLGLPSVALPVGIADGLPQGVQLVAARYREDICLDAAEAVEAALGIFTPIDPVSHVP